MTNDGNYDEDSDPLLVRPFVLGDYDRTAVEPSRQTWPVNATREVRSHRARERTAAPTEVLFTPAEPMRFNRHRLLVLAATGAAVLVGATAASLAVLRPDDDRPPATALQDPPPLGTDGPLPGAPSPLLSTSPSLPAGDNQSAAPPSSAPPGAGVAGSAPAPAGTATAEVPSVVTSPSTAAPGETTTPPALAGPPPPDGRTGRIRGQNGVCLDGVTATEGAAVAVAGCTASGAQTWTLATDGTMRVLEMCALAAADGTVHTSACDGRSTEQWSISGQRLINTSTAKCLTDPAGGSRQGTKVTVALCGGAATQRWSLPN